MKSCRDCGEMHEVKAKHGNGKYYYKSYCNTCCNLRQKAGVYGITLDTILELKSIDKCQICYINLPETKDRFIDHCHETGNVRGVLCTKCNSGLGQFKDNTEILLNAIKYLNYGK